MIIESKANEVEFIHCDFNLYPVHHYFLFMYCLTTEQVKRDFQNSYFDDWFNYFKMELNFYLIRQNNFKFIGCFSGQ